MGPGTKVAFFECDVEGCYTARTLCEQQATQDQFVVAVFQRVFARPLAHLHVLVVAHEQVGQRN
jgi:hypothetical protein